MMLYVDLVLAPLGEVAALNPLQVGGIKWIYDEKGERVKDRCSLILNGMPLEVFGDKRLVQDVLSGNTQAIKAYDKKWTKPAIKEGPRRVAVAQDPTAGGILIGDKDS
ncbi:MAG: hypothetical protein ACE5F1_01010 [Planctomycetota bacterium]